MSTTDPTTSPSALVLEVDAIVFDCDGVLIDSIDAVTHSWRRWAGELGLDPDEVLGYIHGRPSRESAAHFVPDGRFEEALRRIDAYELEDAHEIRELPGARALLEALPLERVAIVTSATRALFEARFGAAGLPRPERTISADDVTDGKPHPEGYLAAIAAIGADPHRAAIFEDSDSGIRAAVAAGAHVIRVGEGSPRPGEAAVVGDLRSVRWDGRLHIG